MRHVSRRDFLKRAGILSAGTGLIAGCAKNSTETADTGAAPADGGPKATGGKRKGGTTETMSGPGGEASKVVAEGQPSGGAPAGGEQPAQPGAAKAGGQVIVAKGGDSPAALVRAAVEALGGMGTFVKAGQTVCLKPNASWDRGPGSGANTHPEVLSEVIKMCKAAGAREVIALDYTLASAPLEWNGLKEAAEGAGGKFIELTGSNSDMFDEIDFVPGLKALPGIGPKEKVAFDFLQADVCINMPVLKTHSATGLSIGLKNLMGVIWDRRRYHGGGSGAVEDISARKSQVIDQAIADLGFLLRDRIGLTIVDASYVMRSDSGPRGRDEEDGDAVMHVLAGTDMVACDAQAARIFGMNDAQMEQKVPCIGLAAGLGLGTMDTKALARFEEVTV